MFKKIYKAIKKYDTIVIARHVGVDPDAMASQLSLKESILLTFPKKRVLAVGNGGAVLVWRPAGGGAGHPGPPSGELSGMPAAADGLLRGVYGGF